MMGSSFLGDDRGGLLFFTWSLERERWIYGLYDTGLSELNVRHLGMRLNLCLIGFSTAGRNASGSQYQVRKKML